MALTEVVFEVVDQAFPGCRFTGETKGSRLVFHEYSRGPDSGMKSSFTLHASRDDASGFINGLRLSRSFDQMEVLGESADASIIQVLRHSGSRATPLALDHVLDAFDGDAHVESCIVEAGVLRARMLVVGGIDAKRVLLNIQRVQREAGEDWDRMRIVRINEMDGRRYADLLRRVLNPDQETLLRLALSLGYYSSPKGCNLDSIARHVGLSVSPVHKKLKRIEQILVNAHIDPTTIAAHGPRRRGLGWGHLANLSSPMVVEICLRVRWPSFIPARFTGDNPAVRIIYQSGYTDGRTEEANAVLVVVASAADQDRLIADLRNVAGTNRVDVVARDASHATMRLTTTVPTTADWAGHPNPFPRLALALGRDVIVKPTCVEDGWISIKIITCGQSSLSVIRARVEGAARDAGWAEYEVGGVRELDGADGKVGVGPEKLTPRQEEVLKIAHALGYYRTPRSCTLEGVAKTLGISANAIHKNLTSAEQKIFTAYVVGGV